MGIGNPGSAYAATRHNVGWFVLDALIDMRRGQWRQASGPYLEAHIPCGETSYVLIKPLTYVNRTGEAARIACEAYGIFPSELLVVVDDVHLPTGALRLRQGGSSGGHKGMDSLIAALGTEKVPRLRIGIGAPAHPGALVEYVLSPFTPEEEEVIRRAVVSAAQIAEAFGRGGYDEAATVYGRLKADSFESPPHLSA